MEENGFFIIGIGGGSASGKTMFAWELAKGLSEERTTIIDIDSYYNDFSHISNQQREKLNFDDPAIIDKDLLVSHIKTLKSGRSIKKPIYSFESHCRTDQHDIISPKPFVIIEGLFTLVLQELHPVIDLKIFIDASDDLRIIRRIQRDRKERGRSVNSIIDQYLRTVRSAHITLIEPSRDSANIIVNWDTFDADAITEAIELILTEYDQGL